MTTYYTVAGRSDGFGAQYQAILSGIAFCEYNNYKYVHTPFERVAHFVDTNKANNFIGINNTVILPTDVSYNIITKHFSEEVHFSSTPSIYYTDKVLDYVRRCYYSTAKPLIDNIDIAIHIRRGDITKGRCRVRYTDNSFYIELIKKLKEVYPTYKITVFSEGTYKDFEDLGLDKSCFKLNTDMFETFHSLVCAKVLIQAGSSFSYCAGLLNTNTVYHFDKFWHSKLDHWQSVSSLVSIP